MHRPLIGLTAGLRRGTAQGGRLVVVRQKYVESVLDNGGLPLVIPPAPEDVLRGIFERLDGLLLPGGGDIEPRYFGEKPHPKLDDVEPERDLTELALCRWALAEDKPVLGICRGIQVMNVATGGTLYQDIPAQYETTIVHAPARSNPRGYLAHTIVLEPPSRLAGLVGQQPLPVNSWHHQAIRNLGSDLVVSARAPDGIVEGVEVPGRRFAVAVQFHPEDLYEADERVRRLFAGFIAVSGG